MCGIFNKTNGYETHGNHIKIKNKGFIHLTGVVICHHRAMHQELQEDAVPSASKFHSYHTFVGSSCLAILSTAYSFICATNDMH
jgi:hypothetical protein